jgi:hypothetical protein
LEDLEDFSRRIAVVDRTYLAKMQKKDPPLLRKDGVPEKAKMPGMKPGTTSAGIKVLLMSLPSISVYF